MKQKIALVTGGNRGIGLETSRQLAAQGVHVIVAARDAAKAAATVAELQADNGSAEALQLDVTDAASIKAAVDTVSTKHGHLDILVNNAGIIRSSPDGVPSHQPVEDWRWIFETNVFGLVETTQAFLPLLKKAPAARIVNLSSLLGSIGMHETPGSPIYEFKSVPAYSASKSAVNAYTEHLAWELRDTPIKVNAAHPGYVKTDMNHGGGELEVPDGARTSVALALLGADGPSGKLMHVGEVLPW
ncbi:SDR family oxidoreductase [Solimonas terrae]|uniref:SDR family oxidoreductase n=1 Tax=Solimonas terrae TaxID=1396819 RepID=A0A6M2BSJ7_9GAMM|nr:SDR family oxidoreductase [Solimonas terrae]NGY05215.1 SDR family oxidoreductase [Solimonas terrae]